MKKFLSLKRAVALCLAVCMIAGLLAGCGGGSSDTSDGGAAAEVDTSTLTVALTSEPDYLSTCDHDSLMGVQMNLLTYNGLMRIDMETLEPVCDLAESYTQDSDTEWTFTLKQGVKFHNGDDFTADDVVASIEYAQTFPASTTYTGAIASVEARCV